jgi:hypothetical protein
MSAYAWTDRGWITASFWQARPQTAGSDDEQECGQDSRWLTKAAVSRQTLEPGPFPRTVGAAATPSFAQANHLPYLRHTTGWTLHVAHLTEVPS